MAIKSTCKLIEKTNLDFESKIFLSRATHLGYKLIEKTKVNFNEKCFPKGVAS